MQVTWLHVSDFHLRGGDPYESDLVLKTLVKSVDEYRKNGRAPDLIFATGDIAFSGKTKEYKRATTFFNELLAAAKLEKRRLFVIPGNHDVDRDKGLGLARTLDSREAADKYFNPAVPKPHLTQKMGRFVSWYNAFFKGIRSFPKRSTCGPVELVDVKGRKLAILPINSALFCLDDNDSKKLLIGRRCLDAALKEIPGLNPHLTVALIHHPMDWLSDVERANIKPDLMAGAQFILRGHLHETETERVDSGNEQSLFLAAGAAYQTLKWPNCAMYGTLEGNTVSIFPIRYEDKPREVWTVDPSVFPGESKNEFAKKFSIPGASSAPGAAPSEAAATVVPRFRSNVPAHAPVELVGRENDLAEIQKLLGDPHQARMLALHGHSGAGKSELAAEFARRNRQQYPGGILIVGASGGDLAIEFARLGKTLLDLSFPAELGIAEQGQKAFFSLGVEPVLLIYDNVTSFQAVKSWLPVSGMKCHVLITCIDEHVEAGWLSWEVLPLSHTESLTLIEKLGGREVLKSYGEKLAEIAGGLPIQICPAALTLGYEERRGRLKDVEIELAPEAASSFRMVYERLEPPVKLLLHSAAFLNPQRIPRNELFEQLSAALDWKEMDFNKSLNVCLDLHLLEGTSELKMHQLLRTFLLSTQPAADNAKVLEQVRQTQSNRFRELATNLGANPARADLASTLVVFPLTSETWEKHGQKISIHEGETIGRALYEIGRFDEARPWFERAVTEKEKGDEQGLVDHDSVGSSLHHVGYCLSKTGKHDEARPWFERAVTEKEKGDVDGRVDHESVAVSLHQVGYCFSSTARYDLARPCFERAVSLKEKGDVEARVDNDSVGSSLYQVGYCFSCTAKYDEARPWYQRAVAEVGKGDVHGRINHHHVSLCLQQVGACQFSTDNFDEARSLYERAVTEAEKGDLYGRVDHDSVGVSFHQVGDCLLNTGKFDEARLWYERAVTESEKGDVHERVDHDNVGISLSQVGYCLTTTAKYGEARPWLERALTETEKGDVHARVNHESVSRIEYRIGNLLFLSGKYEDACLWFERSVGSSRQGDIFGSIDRTSLAVSLRAVAKCLRQLGELQKAESYEKEAADLDQAQNHGSPPSL